MKRWSGLLLYLFVLILSTTGSVQAAEYTCGRDRVIDPDGQISDVLAADWNTQSHNMDRYDFHMFLYAAAKADVENGKTIGNLELELFHDARAVSECGLNEKSVILGIAPNVDPNGPYKDQAITEMWYGTDTLRDRLQAYYLSGQTDNVMLQFANRIDKTVVDGTWQSRLIPELMGLNETMLSFAPKPTAVAPVAVATAQVVVVPQPVSTSNSGPSGVFYFFLILVGLAVLCGLGYVVYRVYILWLARTDARNNAISVRREASALFNDWNDEVEGPKARAQVRITGIGEIDPSEIAALAATLLEAQAIVSAAGAELTALSRQENMNPERDLTTAGYEAIVKTYTAQRDKLRNAESMANKVSEDAEELRKTAGAAAGKVADAGEMRTQSASRVDVVIRQGFVVDVAELFKAAEQSFATANENMVLKRYIKAHAAAVEAIRLFEEAALEVEALPAKKAELEELYQALLKLVETKAVVAAKAAGYFAALAQFNRESYADVVGNEAEANNRVAWAKQNSLDMRAAIDEQDFPNARAEHDQAVNWLNEVDDLVEAIDLRKKQIEEAKAKIAALLAEARKSLEAAQKAVTDNDLAVPESFEENCRKLAVRLDQLDEMAQQEKPDYVALSKLLRGIDADADEIYKHTLEAAQALSRVRAQVAEAKKVAVDSLAAANKYFANHRGDIKRNSCVKLDDAQEKLETADEENVKLGSSGLEDDDLIQGWKKVAQLYSAADDLADAALKAAQDDVEEANEPVYVSVPSTNTHSTTWGTSGASRPGRTGYSTSTPSWNPVPSTRPSMPSLGSSSGTHAMRSSSPSPSFRAPSSLGSSSGTRATRG